ncbi:uncharacterized protein BDR25DRAFT_266319 [Lindgomyces ingoldianus]|uniref:Uncharacterized protein n=1 Tax=Lindgomyces ingoldianus TaxID=673940 RepID=A0ACB6QLL5_9PLEO|nr:uncharacterized protein BDR25DRAFT_266319 [Lindgomyces ingoldianus]KAF2467878.1 hypothetical protein BDR25DRAFT_266319 [Lindgomyces ingoldianus]
MIPLRRRAFALSIAIVFFLLMIHLNFRPFTAYRIHAIFNGTQHAEELFQNRTDSPAKTPSSKILPDSVATKTTADIALETSPAITPDKILVVAKLKSEDTNWVSENFPDWQNAIYTVDDPDATLHTSMNKGREASAYLTYIIENYSNLPSTIVFLHSHRNHDHGSRDVEDLNFDNVATIKALHIDFIQKTGYANLRCILNPGCPAEIQPFRPDEELSPLKPQERAMVDAWAELFGNDNVPQVLAAPCCAQFAVSREQVLKRPKEEYERFLKWLLDTPLNDYTSGRVFEYLWHVIFGRESVFCPDMEQCYRDLYGTSPPPLNKGNISSSSSVP